MTLGLSFLKLTASRSSHLSRSLCALTHRTRMHTQPAEQGQLGSMQSAAAERGEKGMNARLRLWK